MSSNGEGRKRIDERVRPAMAIAVGALSFMMLYDPLFFVGLGAAVAALVLASPCLKKPDVKVRVLACVGVTLALTGAITYVISIFSHGFLTGIV